MTAAKRKTVTRALDTKKRSTTQSNKSTRRKTPPDSAQVVTIGASKQKVKRRVLIIAHNHPHFFPGGAEIIAYDLFNAMKLHSDTEPFFMAGVAASDRKLHTGTPFQMLHHAEDEILFWGADFDYFLQSQNIKSFMTVDFRLFLEKHRPDVIHFHHTMRIGLEALQIARQVLPGVRIIYTLHEFILICNRDGQMVRKHNDELCTESSPARCNQCFPDISPASFKMREAFIKAHLEHVDHFVSPSHFLAKRFMDWGIEPEKITVIENGRNVSQPAPARPLAKDGRRNVFGYFGQINPYKGAMLTFRAVAHLVNQGFTDFRYEISGNVEQQSDDFKTEFYGFLDKYREQVGFHGKYGQGEIGERIAPVDWVIVPSTWWENSPLVIQEAFMHKRPVICSNIGGMAEKVQDGVTGLHFTARNEMSLAKTMHAACQDPAQWQTLSRNIAPRLTVEECAEKYVEVYDQLNVTSMTDAD